MTEINETLLRSIIAEVMKEMSANTNETVAETSEKPVTKPVSNEKAVIRTVTPLAVHTDGEKAGFQRLITWELEPEKLSFIIS